MSGHPGKKSMNALLKSFSKFKINNKRKMTVKKSSKGIQMTVKNPPKGKNLHFNPLNLSSLLGALPNISQRPTRIRTPSRKYNAKTYITSTLKKRKPGK